MEGHAEHLVWYAAGAKLASIDQLLAEYRQRAEQKYLEPMSVNSVAGKPRTLGADFTGAMVDSRRHFWRDTGG